MMCNDPAVRTFTIDANTKEGEFIRAIAEHHDYISNETLADELLWQQRTGDRVAYFGLLEFVTPEGKVSHHLETLLRDGDTVVTLRYADGALAKMLMVRITEDGSDKCWIRKPY